MTDDQPTDGPDTPPSPAEAVEPATEPRTAAVGDDCTADPSAVGGFAPDDETPDLTVDTDQDGGDSDD